MKREECHMDSEKSENHINDKVTDSGLVASFHRSQGFEAVTDMLDQYSRQNAALMADIVGATGIHNELGKIVDSLAFASSLSEIIDAQKLSSISALAFSPAYEILDSANFSIGGLFDSSNAIVEAFANISSISESWQSQFASINLSLEAIQPSKFVIDSHLAQISELSILTQSSLAHLNWDQIGNALQLTPNIQNILQDDFLSLTRTYSDLFDYLGEQPAIIASLPVFASELPTVELFNETNLLESVTIQEEEDFEFKKQKQHVRKEIQAETNDKLADLLIRLNEDLIPLWDGARLSLNSDNPERVRHTAISLRELFTHVLHTLAPDAEVKNWTNSPEHYHNKRPTRKARLLYICREINHGPFTDFIEADIHSTLKFLDLFQKGTHKIVIKYQERQLRAMLVRMESTLRFLLEIKMNGK
jgi:hypothetical protein